MMRAEQGYSVESMAEASQKTREKEYWLNKLSGELEKSCFPLFHKKKTKNPRHQKKNRLDEKLSFQLRGDIFARLMKMANRSDLRLYIVLITGVVGLLHKYTGNRDILIGAPIDRQERDTGFINTVLILRNTVAGDMTFKDLLLRVSKELREAAENVNYPLETLLHKLEIPYSSGDDFPLFDTAALLKNIHEKSYLEHIHLNIIFSFEKKDNHIEGELEYNAGLYGEETAAVIITHYRKLLTDALHNPGISFARLTLPSGKERRQLLEEFNDKAIDLPIEKTLPQLFAEQMERKPDNTALVGPKEETGKLGSWEVKKRGDIFVTYKELNEKSRQLAQLLGDKGVKPDTIVAMMVEPSLEMIIGILGILKAGGAYLPIDPEYPEERVQYMLEDSMVNILVKSDNNIRAFDQGKEKEKAFKEIEIINCQLLMVNGKPLNRRRLNNPPQEANSIKGNHLAYVIYTSGTTGKPKGSLIRHGNVAALMRHHGYWFDFGGDDVWTLFHSYCFDFSVWEIYGALLYGGKLILLSRNTAREPHRCLELLKSRGVTILNQTPPAFYQLMRQELEHPDRQLRLRYVIFGGETLSPARLKPWYEKYPDTKLINMFGITETTVHVTFKLMQAEDINDNTGSIGRPLPISRVYVLDRCLELVPPGVAGELCVGGAGLSRGYLNQPELTALKFVKNPFQPGQRLYRSGDLGKWTSCGQLHYLGRLDQQVKIRGYRIELEEIRDVLSNHAGTAEAVVTTLKDGGETVEKGNTALAAYIVPDAQKAGTVKRILELERSNRAGRQPHHEYPNGMTIFYINRHETDFMYHEIFEIQTYLKHGITLERDACILDVGANIGMFSLFISQICPEARVYAFEPLLPIYRVLSLNTWLYCQRTKIFPYGISHQEDEVEFTYYPHAAALSGRFADKNQEIEMVKAFIQNELPQEQEPLSHRQVDELLQERLEGIPFTCQLKSLSQFFHQENLQRVDLLKIDVEKCELEVLQGIAPGDWPKIRQLTIEVHDFDNRLKSVVQMLKQNGYRVEVEQDRELQNTCLYNVYAVRPNQARELPIPSGPNPGTTAVETAPGSWQSPTRLIQDIRGHLAGKLPGYMIPSYLVLVVRLPLTANGKVDMKALPAPALDSHSDYTAPRDEIETKLVEIWVGVLSRDASHAAQLRTSLGIDNNFFELGGHSLKATILASKIHKEMDVKLPLVKLFKNPTIRELGKYIRKQAKEKFILIELVEKKEYYALSSAQKRLYFLQQVDLTSTAYNMPMVLPLGKEVEKNRLEWALKRLIQSHESLRTSIEKVNQLPVQRVHDPGDIDFAMDFYDAGQARANEIINNFIRPFDLNRAPLIRSGIIRLPDHQHIWVLDIHHIISDGTSQTILTEDFLGLYNGKTLTSRRLQYKEFAAWQNRLFASGKIKEQEEYWLSLYEDAGDIPRLALPSDCKRPGVFRFSGDSYGFTLERGDAVKFRELGIANGATLYMNILAALNTLFYRYTGQKDIIIGSGIAGRRHQELQGIVGMFVNTLAMRNYPRGGKNYRTFLQEVRDCCIKAFENQDVQFEELVEKLDLERDPSRNPLFDITMVVQNFRHVPGNITLPLGEKNNPAPTYRNTTSKFDMTFFIVEEKDDIYFNIEYYTGIFKEETVKRLASHFKNIVRTVIRHSSITLKEIDIISEEERKQLLYDFNDTANPYPRDKTIPALFEAQVERTPGRIALSAEMENSQLTYRELDTRAGQVACYLYKKRVKPGTPVGLLVTRSLNRPLCLLGILKAGTVYVPLDPSLPRERIKFIIKDAGIGLIISEKRYLNDLNRLQWECNILHTYLCMDSLDIRGEDEIEKNQLMNKELWHHVGETATDDITGGGWVSSYTGKPLSGLEMEEYGDNILKKLEPLLHPGVRVLEIGCASGITMYQIAPRVGLYYGTDLSWIIIERNKKRVRQEGRQNIKLAVLAAHDIRQIDETNFDLIIINSVIQCFHGYNYLLKVIREAVNLLGEKGHLFLGDIMDLEKKEVMKRELEAFKYAHREKDHNYTTKTDFSSELFVPKGFWQDLAVDMDEITAIEFSHKIYTVENELTKYRYDVLLKIDKTEAGKGVRNEYKRHKYQEDYRAVSQGDELSFPSSLNVPIESGSMAYIIYTSGTTGYPRGVMIPHYGISNLSAVFKDDLKIRPRDHIVQFAAVSFDVSVWEIFMALLSGSALCLPGQETTDELDLFHDYMNRYQITVATLPPLYANQLNPGELNTLRLLITAGSSPAVELVEKCSEHFEYINAYGPTEVAICSSYWGWQAGVHFSPIPIGKPIRNRNIYIFDENQSLQPIGAAGELFISGVGVAPGYLNNPELTAEKFCLRRPGGAFEKLPPGPPQNFLLNSSQYSNNPGPHLPYSLYSSIYKTGDLGRWLADGNIEFLGRIDHQVKIRGFRIELEEIEARLSRHHQVKEAVVINRGENGDAYLCAYTTAEGTLDFTEIRSYLSKYLPGYMVPPYFIEVDKIPVTPSGKVNRKALPAPRLTGEAEYEAPANEMEEKLALIWSDVLSIEKDKISREADFFQLGGHSLKATILVSMIHSRLNVKIPLAEVFKTPFIRGLARWINAQNPGESRFISLGAVETREYYHLSSAQKRLYFLQQMDIHGTAYNMPMVLPLEKHIDRKKLEVILRQLISRHEILRTSFIRVADEPVQRIHDEVEFNLDMRDVVTDFIKPFDLSKAPLMRSFLARQPGDNYTWVLDMHHIISDGTSHTILTEDFFALYRGRQLAPLRLHYKDFAQWQNLLFVSDMIKTQEEYWLKLFSDDIPRLNLLADYKRPDVFTFSGERYGFAVEGEVAAKFKALGARKGATLYMNILAALNILFYKYTGQTDIIIGSGIAGRPHADLQRIVGMFVNMLAMRNYPRGEKTYESILNEVKEHSLQAFENQDVQFEELVERLALERYPAGNPLFDITMVVQNFRRVGEGNPPPVSYLEARDSQQPPGLSFSGENLPPVSDQNVTAKFDMTFFIHEWEDDIEINIEYYTGIFKEDTIKRLAIHFQEVIKAVSREPGIKLMEIDIIPVEEREQLLYTFNKTYRDYPRDKSLDQLFQELVRERPDRIALVGRSAGTYPGLTISLSYRELNKQAQQLANYLCHHPRVQSQSEELVGILLERSIDLVIAILGVLKAGAGYLPLEDAWPETRIRHIIDDAGIKIIISQKKFIRTLNRLQWDCPSFRVFLCLDSIAAHAEEEAEKSELMNEGLWNYIAESAVDEITGGGWFTSYTGEPFTRQEMEEYADNILKKLTPLLHPGMKILEIGCGSGLSMCRLAPRVGHYYAADLSQRVIEKNREKIKEKGYTNIDLFTLPAHEIDKIKPRDFDMVIINSVIQSFPGHNYLRQVIAKSMEMIAKHGYLFIGDVLDQQLKDSLIREMTWFKAGPGGTAKTKTDWTADLFVSRSFFQDLSIENPGIINLEYSRKIYTIENELTKFRYDVLITIDKTGKRKKRQPDQLKHKYQHDMKALAEFSSGQLQNPARPGDVAYVIYTSGSTGRPRGVVVEQRNVARLAVNTNYIDEMGIKEGDRFLVTGAFAFDISTFEIWGMLLNGVGLYMVEKEVVLEAEKLYRAVVRQGISIMHLIPQLFNHHVDHCPGIFSKLRCLLVGGDVVSPVTAERLRNTYRHLKILHMYGPTENTTFSTFFPLERDHRYGIPIGKPISNTTVYILDTHNRLQPIGVGGELCTGGSGVSRGYLNNPELTFERFINYKLQHTKYKQIPSYKIQISNKDAPIGQILNALGETTTHHSLLTTPPHLHSSIYRAGDWARWLADGNIEFLGRIDRQVKIRGFRIELGEIEICLLRHEDIREAVVIDKEEAGEKYLCAYLVLKNQFDDAEIRDYLLKYLPDYMIPTYFVRIDKFPLTSNGKIDKRALPAPSIATGQGYEPPGNDIEAKLVQIWSDVLNIEPAKISIDSDFFQLGGHSLKVTILMSKIHKNLDVKLPLAEIFKTPRIRKLSQYIKSRKKDRYMSIQPVEEKEYYSLSPAQKRLYFLQQLVSDNTGYNMPYVIPIQEPIDKEKLETVFKKLIARHESFRTSFKIVNREPVQRIHKSVEFAIEYYETTETGKESIIANFKKPFNLSRAPLLRVGLLNVPSTGQVLLIDMHHILTDGTAQDILQKEFMTLYWEPGTELVPLRLQCKDYSEWQNSLNREELIKQQQEYWCKEFSSGEEVPVLNLPTDYPRPAIQDFEGNRVSFVLNTMETNALKDTAEENNVTLYMCLLAVLNVLLFKLSGQEDIIIGTPIAARRHSDLQQIIGMLVNTLAMRNYPSADKNFGDFITEVRQRTLQAYENQEYPFEMLVDKISAHRDTSRNPLFDVMLNLLNQSEYRGGIEEIVDQPPYRHQEGVSRFDLVFNVIDMGHTILINLEYSTRLYAPTTIEKFIKYLENIILSLPGNMEQKLSQIQWISTEEKEEILRFSNGENENLGNHQTIPHLFKNKAREIPGKISLIFEKKHLSYWELNHRVNRLARILREKGVGTGNVVGIMVERSLEMIIAVLSVLEAGAAYLPIDTQYPLQRILTMLDDSQAPLLLTTTSSREQFSIISLKGMKTTHQQQEHLVITPKRIHIKDFDSLPYPQRTLVNYEKYHQFIGIAMAKHTVSLQATRGCPFNCAYCHKIWPKTHVTRSARSILEEIQRCYRAGVRRFVFIDDIFNLDKRSSSQIFERIIKQGLDMQLFFPNGLRGDILDKDLIDLMIEAGAVNIAVALESASPRIQKLIGKNLNLEKFRENVRYITEKYPRVLLEMEMMIGFPTETAEEALMTFDFLKDLKWVHFPNLHILKIYPNTDMYKLALENGISEELIRSSANLAFHELPETLPFTKGFVKEYQTRLLNDYFLCKERLLDVLPHQVKTVTRDELVQKYNSYLPMEINRFQDILDCAGISSEELGALEVLPDDHMAAPGFREKMKIHYPPPVKKENPFRVLMLDLSLFFSRERAQMDMLYDMVEEPLGLMYLVSYLHEKFKGRVWGKIAKSRIDFDSFQELKNLLYDFKPHLIGIRTLSYYKEFFHRTVLVIRQWGIEVPIIAGGPYATSDYKFILQDHLVDIAVLGEGEHTLSELVEKMIENNNRLPEQDVLRQIQGISFVRKESPGANREKAREMREILLLDEIPREENQYLPGKDEFITSASSHDPVYVIYTSGSTGQPKGVILPQRALTNLIYYQYRHTDIDFNRVLQFTTLGFDVSAQEIFSTLLAGGVLTLVSKETITNIPKLLKVVEQEDIRTLFMPFSFFKAVINEKEFIKRIPKGIRHMVIAGEQLVINEAAGKYLKDSGVRLHNHYGPSETHVVTTFTIDPRGNIPAIPSIGCPIGNTSIYLLEKSMNLVPVGVAGELYIGGIQVGRGYINNPELTFDRFVNYKLQHTTYKQITNYNIQITNKLYQTGDLARWHKDGNIEFLGRTDHQVKIRGFRIELEEIANQMRSCEGIKEAVVVVRENNNADKYLCAYVSVTKELTVSGLRGILLEKLPDYMIPAYFVQLENIPLTASGKIDRNALPEPELEGSQDYQAPRDSIEEKLVEIWSEILGVKREIIGIDTNFFEIGGHSLKATSVIYRINSLFKMNVPMVELFKAPYIRQMGEYIKNATQLNISFHFQDDNLLLLRQNPGKAGNIFFIHDGTGEVDGYVEFCKRLKTRVNCWGIRANRLENYTPLNLSIEETATHYIEKIKIIQPRGPYSIAGWSLGGVIVFEMAVQLEEKGEEISFLCLIDSPAPQGDAYEKVTLFSVEPELNLLIDYWPDQQIIEKLKNISHIDEIWSILVNQVEENNFSVERIKSLLPDDLARAIPNYNQAGTRDLIYYLNMYRTLIQALQRYIPGSKINTPVHYFNASQTPGNIKDDWKDYCSRSIMFYEMEGDHFSLLKPPQVNNIAKFFDKLLY